MGNHSLSGWAGLSRSSRLDPVGGLYLQFCCNYEVDNNNRRCMDLEESGDVSRHRLRRLDSDFGRIHCSWLNPPPPFFFSPSNYGGDYSRSADDLPRASFHCNHLVSDSFLAGNLRYESYIYYEYHNCARTFALDRTSQEQLQN